MKHLILILFMILIIYFATYKRTSCTENFIDDHCFTTYIEKDETENISETTLYGIESDSESESKETIEHEGSHIPKEWWRDNSQ